MRYWIGILLLFFSFQVFSQEKAVISEQQQIEEALQDTTNRFVLSVFGSKALDAFAHDYKDVDFTVIDNYPKEQVKKLTTPFYEDNYKRFMFFGLVSALTISITLLLIYLTFLGIDGLNKTQSSGDLFGVQTTTIYFVSKVLLSILFVYPFYYPYNVVQIAAFKIAGYSNSVVRDINDAAVNSQPRYYPSIKLPASDAKVLEAIDILKYLTCARLDSRVKANEIVFTFYAKGDVIKSESSVGNCYLSMEAGIDTETGEIIKNSEEVRKIIDVDFIETQKQIHQKLFSKILEKASNASAVLAAPLDTVRSNSVAFNQFISSKSGDEESLVFWEKSCPEILNYKVGSTLTATEKKEYLYLAGRCLSYEIAKIIAYPTTDSEIGRYLKTSNYLKDNHIELCSHSFGKKPEMRTAISEIGQRTYAKTVLTQGSNLNTQSVEECVSNACSQLNGEYTNALICANAIYLLNEHKKNDFMSKSGFMGMGATMYSYFTGYGVSESSKVMYNKFKTKFLFSGTEINQPKTADIVYTIKVSNNKSANNDEKIAAIYREVSRAEIAAMRPLFIDNDKTQGLLSASVDSADILGFGRFSVCVRKPQGINEGFACSSVPEELHKFGYNLMSFGFFAKITSQTIAFGAALKNGGKATYEVSKGIAKKAKNKSVESRVNANEKANEKKENTETSQTKTNKALSGILNMVVPATMVGTFAVFFDPDHYEVDEFGVFDNRKYQDAVSVQFTGTGVFLGVIAAASGNTIVGELLQAFFTFLIVLGMFMAYVLPLIPFVLWILVIISWCVSLFALIIMLPVWLPLFASPIQTHFSDFDSKAISAIKTLLFKAPMLAAGLIAAWVLSNTLLSKIMSIFSFDQYVSVIGGDGVSALFDAVIAFVILTMLFFILTAKIYALIENFEEFAMSWISGNPQTSGLIQEKSAGLFGQMKQIKNMTKSKLNMAKFKK